MRCFPLPKFAIAQRHLFSFKLEDVKRLRRFGQKRQVNERRLARENGASAFDADVEKDDGGGDEHEIGGDSKKPKRGPLQHASPPPQ